MIDANAIIDSVYGSDSLSIPLLIPDQFSVCGKKSRPTQVFSVSPTVILSESEHRVDDVREYLYSIRFHVDFLSQRKNLFNLPAWHQCHKQRIFTFGNGRVARLGSSGTRA